QRKSDADGRVQVRPRYLAHEQNDPHHHQPRCHYGCRPGDRVRECLAHHPTARCDKDEQERPVELREQPAPLLVWVPKVRHRTCDVSIDPAENPTLSLLKLLAHGSPLSYQDAAKLRATGCECITPMGASFGT